jgi:hypothetical protein
MTSKVPKTRAELLGMAKEIEDQERANTIKVIVDNVYGHVLGDARNRNRNQYGVKSAEPTVSRYSLSNIQRQVGGGYETFLKHNIGEILEKVRELFPDCEVSTKMLVANERRDRTMVYTEISPFSQYPAHSIESYIVVDWS